MVYYNDEHALTLGVRKGLVKAGVQFMVHDGDQNKVGGDTGQGCATVFVK